MGQHRSVALLDGKHADLAQGEAFYPEGPSSAAFEPIRRFPPSLRHAEVYEKLRPQEGHSSGSRLFTESWKPKVKDELLLAGESELAG